jgi:uncharacterized membrane protein YidH (DUF202 family)
MRHPVARRQTNITVVAKKFSLGRSEMSGLNFDDENCDKGKKIKQKFRNMFICAILVLMLFSMLGTFYLQQNDSAFKTNFDAFYFTVITMTTIGNQCLISTSDVSNPLC